MIRSPIRRLFAGLALAAMSSAGAPAFGEDFDLSDEDILNAADQAYRDAIGKVDFPRQAARCAAAFGYLAELAREQGDTAREAALRESHRFWIAYTIEHAGRHNARTLLQQAANTVDEAAQDSA